MHFSGICSNAPAAFLSEMLEPEVPVRWMYDFCLNDLIIKTD